MTAAPLVSRLLATAHRVSVEVPHRTGEKVYLHLLSELGELGEEANIQNGELYKSAGPDGVVGEACDVVNCIADLIWVRCQQMGDAAIESVRTAISHATVCNEIDGLPVLPFGAAKTEFALVTSDLRRVHDLSDTDNEPMSAEDILAVGRLLRTVLLLAKAAKPDLSSDEFSAAYEMKCQKWLQKAGSVRPSVRT